MFHILLRICARIAGEMGLLSLEEWVQFVINYSNQDPFGERSVFPVILNALLLGMYSLCFILNIKYTSFCPLLLSKWAFFPNEYGSELVNR